MLIAKQGVQTRYHVPVTPYGSCSSSDDGGALGGPVTTLAKLPAHDPANGLSQTSLKSPVMRRFVWRLYDRVTRIASTFSQSTLLEPSFRKGPHREFVVYCRRS